MATPYRFGNFFEGNLLEPISGEKWALYSSMAFKKGEKGYVIGTTNAGTTAYGVSIPFDWELLHNKWVCFSVYADWSLGVTSANYWGILGTNAIPRVWWSYQTTGLQANRYVLGENAAVPITQSSTHPQPKKYNHHVFFVNYDTVNDILKTYIYQNGELLEYIALPNGSTAKTFANAPKFLTFGYAIPLKNYSFLRTYTDVLESEIPSLAASEWKFAQGIRTNQKPVYLMYTQEQFNALPSGSPIIHEDFSNYTTSISPSSAGDKSQLTGKEVNQVRFNLISEQKITGNLIISPLGIDSNLDGLSDGWTKTAGTIASIVTGNGFTGNAQRIETTATGVQYLDCSTTNHKLQSSEYSTLLKVTGTYRCNNTVGVSGVFGSGGGLPFTVNTGDALPFESYVNSTGVIRITSFNLPIGTWFEIGEDLKFEKVTIFDKPYYQKVTNYYTHNIPSASGYFKYKVFSFASAMYFAFNTNNPQYTTAGNNGYFLIMYDNILTTETRFELRKITNGISSIIGSEVIVPDNFNTKLHEIEIMNDRNTGSIKVWVDKNMIFDVIDTSHTEAIYSTIYTPGYGSKLFDFKYSKL